MMSCAVNLYSSLDLTMLGFMKTDYDSNVLWRLTHDAEESRNTV